MNYTEQEIAEANELKRQLNGICHFQSFRHNVENYSSLELKQVDKSFIKINDYERVMSIDELPKTKEVIAKLKEFYTLELRKNDYEENTEVYIVTERTETEQEHTERVEHENYIADRENKLIELAKAALNNRLIKDYFNLQDLLKL